MNLGYLLSKASRLCKQDLNTRLSEMDLTFAQYITLRDIYIFEKKPNPEKNLNPACIATRLQADRPTITGIVQRLLENGWIIKENNPYDKRSFYLVLTEKTLQLMPKLEELDALTIHKAVTNLTEDEKNQLMNTLHKIINNLNLGEEKHE